LGGRSKDWLLLVLLLMRDERTFLKRELLDWLGPLTKFPFGIIETRIRVETWSEAVD